ncbi:inorganic triphosphatase [uncultured Paraglaciecola sp.]|uniref:CYTH domain-containing protein n=1 Tax=uncultured Paraglaciecola sp. TaxID=1765024 RepID=UPI002630D7E9|nr:CYTH domain-containing protein [uncultured Paraglaciecola sp.]
MEYEIELKLLTNEQAGELINTKLLPQINAKVTQELLVLTNHYFDTPDRVLRKHDIGLRIRGNDQKFEQTLKTAGKSIGGLHQRPEYNVQLNEINKQTIVVPELKLFPVSAWPNNLDVDLLQTKIETLFTTHFTRQVFLFELANHDTVELVWDHGEIIANNRRTPICEVELELKKGKVASLFDLARQIVKILPTTIGKDSKAARGYHLLDETPFKEPISYQAVMPNNSQLSSNILVSMLDKALQDYQIYSMAIKNQYLPNVAHDVLLIITDLSEIVAKLHRIYNEHLLGISYSSLLDFAHEYSQLEKYNDRKALCDLLAHPKITEWQLNLVQYLAEQV